jgi:sugar lactone lactonase YvrE
MSVTHSEPVHRLFPTAQQNGERKLTEVYSNQDFQITGITVSKTGRLFVNFPRWSDHYLNAVVEVLDTGATRPFPDENWNRWDMKPATVAKQFVCVQSVVADDQDSLWVLDPAAPLLGPVVAGGAKVVRIDLRTNQVTRVYSFSGGVVQPGTYLNDIRIDTQRDTAYITDSGVGGIIVLDIESGKAHRALDGHPSVMAEEGISISVNGKPVVGPTGQPPRFNSDGIALSSDGEYLYYQALTGATVYRIKTSALREAGPSAGDAVEQVAKTFPADGFWMDAQDRLYLSNINESAVSRLSPDGSIEKLVSDPQLQWPDTFTQGPDGAIYITASHINDAPQFNHGKSPRTEPYSVFKFMP